MAGLVTSNNTYTLKKINVAIKGIYATNWQQYKELSWPWSDMGVAKITAKFS